MALTFDNLIKFNLLDAFEKNLTSNDTNVTKYWDFQHKYQEIQMADRFIKDCPSFPDSEDKIRRSEMVSAIGSTLSIEGSNLDAEEIEESFAKAARSETLKRSEQEAENSREVYDFIIDSVPAATSDEPFVYTEAMIKQMHKYFTDGLNYLTDTPGQYRGEFPTTFGHPRRQGLCRNNSEVGEAMTRFVAWLNERRYGLLTSNPLIKAIMAHYYLTEIHPFADGNGRTARALEALVLYVNRFNYYCFWSLANFWSYNRADYINHLGRVPDTCDPWEFIMWGTQGYLDEIQRIKNRVVTKLKQLMLTDYTRWLLRTREFQEVKINERIQSVVELLARRGRISYKKLVIAPEVKMLYSKVKAVTLKRDFQKMKELGLIRTFLEDGDMIVEANFQKLDRIVYA